LITSDAMFQGKVTVLQRRDGYRFSIDAVLLAGLTKIRESDRVLDLGTGCGIVLLILAFRGRGSEWVGIEIQPGLAELARENVRRNGWEQRIRILETDFREVAGHFPPRAFDVVVSNPPYRAVHTGKINPEPTRAVARHELAASVGDVFKAARHLLPTGGRLGLIYPAGRLGRALVESETHGFSPKELTVIHSRESAPGTLVHVEFLKGGGEELRIAPPFFIYEETGAYTAKMRSLYEE